MKRKNENKNIFKYQGSECPVCIEEMCVESRSVTSPCMHEFCLECIGKWLTESSSSLCPLCKQSIKVIIYNIKSPTKFSKINFPKGFNNAWQLRNKIKNILDNFENIIFKIYDTVRNFLFTKKKDFDRNILYYLIYFGNLECRLKSSETNTYLPAIEISEDYKCWPEIENLIRTRLVSFVSCPYLVDILNRINNKTLTYGKLLNLLQQDLDEIRFNCIKLEIDLFIQKNQNPFAYYEYYVPGDYEHIVFTKEIFLDESVTAALITRIITSINIENRDFTVAGCQINNINQIFCLLEYLCSFDKLISHLSFSAYYILISSGFYTPNNLKKPDIPLIPITLSTCNLIKHCFQKDELENITQTLSNFEKRWIYFKPFVVEDSISSEDNDGSFTITEDNNSPLQSDVYIELSDSDEDALEIVSVNCPIFDLTESVTDDELICEVSSVSSNNNGIMVMENIPNKKRKISFSVERDDNDHDDEKENSDDKSTFRRILEKYLSSNSEPTTSGSVVETNTNTQEAVVAQTNNSDPSEILEHIDCILSDDDDNNDVINNKDVDFIYQPRSVNDFYEYLMSKNLPNS